MNRVFFGITAAFCLFLLFRSRRGLQLFETWREKNRYPKKERLTMFDVRDLLIKGERDLAVRVYCEIFNVGREEACKAVDEIEGSIQPKDF